MPCTGVHDPVFARCLVLENGPQKLAIVSCDLCIMERDLRDLAVSKVPKDLGLTSDNILVCATHTHAAQGGYSKFRFARIATGGYDPALVEDMATQMAQSVVEACKALKNAQVGWGTAQDDRLSANRAVDGGPKDTEIGILRVDGADGTHLAVLTNFSAHPTVMGGIENMQVSAEWPGAYSEAVSEAWGGTAIFLNGSEGNQRPGNPTNSSDWGRVEGMGQALASDVLSALPGISMSSDVKLSAKTQVIPFKSPIAKMLGGAGDPEALCQVLEIGETLWMALPGETCVEIGQRLKEGAKSVGYQVAFVVSDSNQHLGYLVPHGYYIEHPDFYESTMCFVGPRTDDFFVRAFARLSPRPFQGPPDPPEVAAGIVEDRNGMKFLKVSGGPYERGCAAGKAMSSSIPAFMEAFVSGAQEEGSKVLKGPLASILAVPWLNLKPVFAAVSGMAARQFNPKVPEEIRLEIEGLADGAGISYDEAFAISTFLTLVEQKEPLKALSLPSCSNVVAFGPATKDGDLVVGRNLDWEFASVLSKHGMVTLVEPTEGHKFFSVGWPGQCGTLTAMNDAGLTITEESLEAAETSTKGVPIMILLRQVAQYASSVEEAVAMLKSAPGTCGYHVTVSDGKGKTARVVELSATQQAVRIPVNGVLLGCAPWQTTQEFFEGGLPDPSIPRSDGSSEHRYKRIDELCTQNKGSIDPQVMQKIMSDRREDVTGMKNVFNEDTCQSIVFLPAQGKMWVAQGEKPGPASGYTEFSF